jgi:hypothetical protein
VPTREPMMATPTSPLRIFFIVLSFFRLGVGTPRDLPSC